MHNHYVINGYIDFHPTSSTLHDLNNPKNVVVLNSPAARCLLLLIERLGSIVTQHDFLEIVWEKRGMQVSSNTFYQNISILRKGLKKIGLTGNVVVTVPRIGLILASDTHIKKLTTEQQVEANHDSMLFVGKLQRAYETQQQPDEKVEEDAQVFVKPTITSLKMPLERARSLTTSPKLVSRFSHRNWIIGATGVLISVALLGTTLLAFRYNNDSPFFSHYRFLKTTMGCHIFMSEGIISDEVPSKALGLSSEFSEDCKSYPWVYVNRFRLLQRTSVIRCDKPIGEPNTCISDYFVEGQ